jgi:thiamine-monophosphate kinase
MEGKDLVISTDSIAENVHFSSDTDPFRIGWKGAAASLSDIAACGCIPLGIVAGLLLSEGKGEQYIQEIYKGLEAVCSRFGISVSGGDFSSTKGGLVLMVTSFGQVHKKGFVPRSGAQEGDVLFVTGSVGGALEGRHLEFLPRIDEALRLRTLADIHAMIDISDGLYSELAHISSESGIGVQLDLNSVPLSKEVKETYSGDTKASYIHGLCDGEDFELLFTVSPEDSRVLEEQWNMETPITRIGICSADNEAVRITGDIELEVSELTGYSHEF